MARTFGHIREFTADVESIKAYLERVDMFFLANDIAEEKQVPVFLSVVGGKTHPLLCDLFALAKLQEQPLADIQKQLKEHLTLPHWSLPSVFISISAAKAPLRQWPSTWRNSDA